MKKVIILGGGVGACFFALKLVEQRKDVEVFIYEKSDKLASRILVSGNGRCNIYNKGFIDVLPDYELFKVPREIIKNGEGKETFEFLKRILNTDFYLEDGRYYPFSNRSETIFETIKNLVESNERIHIFYNTKIENFEYDRGQLKINNFSHFCDKVVFNLGGMSYNYDKFNYTFLNKMNVKYEKFTPMLCPLKLDCNYLRKYSGSRLYARIKLFYKNDLKYEENGEILIKDDGISGVCIFNATAFINKNEAEYYRLDILFNEHHNVKIEVNKGNYTNNLPKKICDMILTFCEVNKISLDKVLAHGLSFKIKDLYDFKNSQVSKGGIDISEVNLEDFTLKNNPKFIVLGEIINTPLPCGGYNLGLTIIEAYKAAKNIKF